jgi:hypothetical protein
MIPLYGFLEGDTMGLLILAEEGDTTAALAERLQTSAGTRVAPRPRLRVVWKRRILDMDATVAQAGLRPLDRFDVVVSP